MIKTDKGHFWITFKNGYTISIFNGFGSYTENHFNHNLLKQDEILPISSNTCEVAIIYNDILVTDNHLHCGDSVKGGVTSEELADIIKLVSELKGGSNE